jgi:protein lifeguard
MEEVNDDFCMFISNKNFINLAPGYQGGFDPNVGFAGGFMPQHPSAFGQPAPSYPAPGYPAQPPPTNDSNKPANPPYMDPNDPNYAKGFDFSDASIRSGFIRRVYAILSVR